MFGEQATMGEWPALWNSWFATTHHDLGAAMRIMGGFELTVGQHNEAVEKPGGARCAI